MSSPSEFNGPGRELLDGEGFLDEAVYCVRCGTIYVSAAPERSCPSCTNHDEIEALQERVDELEERLDLVGRDLDVIDGGNYD